MADVDGVHVAVVDDDPDVRESLAALLTSAGYQVRTFSSAEGLLGDPAVALTALVITDLQLPRRSGTDLVEALHARHPEVALLMITGYPSVDTARRAFRGGVGDYITKPFEPDALMAAVREALAGRAERRRQRRRLTELRAIVGELVPTQLVPPPGGVFVSASSVTDGSGAGVADGAGVAAGASVAAGAGAAPDADAASGPGVTAGDDANAALGRGVAASCDFGGDGGLVVDLDTRRVFCDGREVPVTGTEYALLSRLWLERPGLVDPRELAEAVRGERLPLWEARELCKSHVRNLRRKLGSGPGGRPRILNVHGRGYRLG